MDLIRFSNNMLYPLISYKSANKNCGHHNHFTLQNIAVKPNSSHINIFLTNYFLVKSDRK